jgi:hypothetical protein
MNQILHIFKKDTRRFWLEILAALVIQVLFVLHWPAQWKPQRYASSTHDLVFLILVLVPVGWWLLIARAVHAEGLVGDTQYWLTRPYEWSKLLAAKALFVGVWVYLPFLVGQTLLLMEGGLSPWRDAGGWMDLALLVSGFAIVPLVALASVTANFARMTVTLFGTLVALLILLIFLSSQGAGYENAVPFPHNIVIVAIIMAGCLFAIVLQYATRRVWLSRFVLMATLLLALGAGTTLSAMHESQIDRLYPVANSARAAGAQFTLTPGNQHAVGWQPSERPGKFYILVPIVLSGVADNTAAQIDDVKFSFDAPDGFHFTAPWWRFEREHFLPGTHQFNVKIMLGRDLYERYRSATLKLNISLAVTELHVASRTTAVLTGQDFNVPGFGTCLGQRNTQFTGQLFCRSAFGPPPLTYVATTYSKLPCSGPQQPISERPTANDWRGSAYADVFSVGPIAAYMQYVNIWPRGLDSRRGLDLCPGTQLYFTRYAITDRTRVDTTIPNFQLPVEKEK